MAQVTSQTVPGGSGLSVRTNMNNIFGALFSSSSGATAPTTTVAGMLWFDTGAVPAVLKRRNSANTGWDKVNPGVSVSDQSGGYTVVEGDRHSFIRCTSATTITFPSAATLGDDWSTIVKADGGDVVLDPDGSETINGNATETLQQGQSAQVFSSGSALFMIRMIADDIISGLPDIIVTGASSGGSGTLELDTVVRNEGSLGSLSANVLTLPAGTYYMEALGGIRFGASTGSTQSGSIVIRDNTAPADLATVSSVRSESFGSSSTRGAGSALVTFGVATDVILHFARGHSGMTTALSHGSGHTSPGDDHVLKVWRVS